MEFVEGNIFKMRTELTDPVSYSLPIGDKLVPMNELIGKKIDIHFTGQINCVACGKKIKRSFNQGFCYSCLQKAPQASPNIIRPELSKAEFGIARDMDWAEKNDLIDHCVYLAVSSHLKVGVTRYHQVPTRWIDQGASCAVKLAKTPNRHIAGVIEVFLKKYFSDKTSWQTMLKNTGNENVNLVEEKGKAIDLLPNELKKYKCNDDQVTEIKYPVDEPPKKIKSISLDKINDVKAVLKGIKGQYLIFQDGTVLNIRKHNGYFIQLNYS